MKIPGDMSLLKKFERLEKKLSIANAYDLHKRLETLEKHKHPEIIGKKEIYNLDFDFINEKQIVELKKGFEEHKKFYNIEDNVAMEKDVNWRIGIIDRIINNEEVLRDHLESHLRVARDQLTDKDRMTIFKEFDKDIENQLKKLDSKKDGKKEDYYLTSTFYPCQIKECELFGRHFLDGVQLCDQHYKEIRDGDSKLEKEMEVKD